MTGVKGTLYISERGIAEAFETENDSRMKFGYFINIKKDSGISATVSIKLCTDQNKIVVFDVRDKVIINGGKVCFEETIVTKEIKIVP